MDMGIGKGDKVAILMFNCNQYLECYFALGKIGAVAVPLNFRLHPDEIVYIVNNADAVAFVVGEQFIDTIRGIQKDLPLVRQYISVTAAPVEGMLHYETLIQKYPDDEPLVLVDEEDPAFIMYTAGTTGRPKGAVLTHQSQVMMWTLASMQFASEPGVGNLWDFRVCSPPPLFHLASFGYCQAHLLIGATVVLPTQVFNPVEVMEIIEREKIDSILLIPAMANFLLQLPDLGQVRRQLPEDLGIGRRHPAHPDPQGDDGALPGPYGLRLLRADRDGRPGLHAQALGGRAEGGLRGQAPALHPGPRGG